MSPHIQSAGVRWQVRGNGRSASRLGMLAASCVVLHGCAVQPPALPASDLPQDPAPAPSVVLPIEPTAYELHQRERALALARQGKLADAALIWELLATIRPKVAEYRERGAEVQRQIDAGVADRLQRGEQAASRGQLDGATQQYLSALALQPDNAKAADALRGIERERNKRNHLGKLSRNTLTRRAMADAEMVVTAEADASPTAAASPGSSSGTVVEAARGAEDRNDTEHASLLASQGEFDEAIKLLERRLRANRRDDAARVLLADVYFQKAETLAAHNSRSAAISLLERSVRTDPAHARATERLKQLRLAAAASRPAAAPVAAASASASAAKPMASTMPAPGTTASNFAVKPAVATITGPAASGAAAGPRR